MFALTSRVERLALRPRSQNLFYSLAQCRSLSTIAEKEPYWQKIKPWKDVTAEEFKSYRWQVRLDTLSIMVDQPAEFCTIAREYRTRYTKIAPFPVRCATTSAWRSEEKPSAPEDQDERTVHRGCNCCIEVSPDGD